MTMRILRGVKRTWARFLFLFHMPTSIDDLYPISHEYNTICSHFSAIHNTTSPNALRLLLILMTILTCRNSNFISCFSGKIGWMKANEWRTALLLNGSKFRIIRSYSDTIRFLFSFTTSLSRPDADDVEMLIEGEENPKCPDGKSGWREGEKQANVKWRERKWNQKKVRKSFVGETSTVLSEEAYKKSINVEYSADSGVVTSLCCLMIHLGDFFPFIHSSSCVRWNERNFFSGRKPSESKNWIQICIFQACLSAFVIVIVILNQTNIFPSTINSTFIHIPSPRRRSLHALLDLSVLISKCVMID